jgi:hypothetical protein
MNRPEKSLSRWEMQGASKKIKQRQPKLNIAVITHQVYCGISPMVPVTFKPAKYSIYSPFVNMEKKM